MVVFVQRIVRLLREAGFQSAGEELELLTSRRLLLFYIESEFAGKRHEKARQMLLQAYDIRALIVLVDGIDEAAGMRNEVEMFVHQELAPSNNRIIITSRPEGVNLPLYIERFVVMNLLELTDEQQRNVIKVQMQGSEFFDHLLAVSEIRKGLDAAYSKAFPSIATRRRLENLPLVDRLALPDASGGSFDPSMRQKEVGGQRWIAERKAGEDPASDYLRGLHEQFMQTVRPRDAKPDADGELPPAVSVLEKLDAALRKLGPGYEEEQLEEAIDELDGQLKRVDLDREAAAKAKAEAEAKAAEEAAAEAAEAEAKRKAEADKSAGG